MLSYWDSEKAQTWTGASVLVIVCALCVFLAWNESAGWTGTLLSILLLSIAVVFAFLLSCFS